MKDMFKTFYMLEPETSQMYSAVIMSPWVFKFLFGMIVDARIVPDRKYYLIGFGLVTVYAQAAVFFQPSSVFKAALMIFLYNFAGAFLDVTIDSIIV